MNNLKEQLHVLSVKLQEVSAAADAKPTPPLQLCDVSIDMDERSHLNCFIISWQRQNVRLTFPSRVVEIEKTVFQGELLLTSRESRKRRR
jgi:hypothetical protein